LPLKPREKLAERITAGIWYTEHLVMLRYNNTIFSYTI
jgi:hypothetical protein